jgi:hypothetical protein
VLDPSLYAWLRVCAGQVIERRTVMDGIWNTALKPADMVLSTGAGEWSNHCGPLQHKEK